MAAQDKWNKPSLLSFLLLIVGGCLFFTGMAVTLPDSSARYAYVLFGLLAVPVSFLWAAYTIKTSESKKDKCLSLTTMVISGLIIFIGILKIV